MNRWIWSVALLSACAGDSETATPQEVPDLTNLAMNDVSVLFPLTLINSSWLDADAPARGGALLPAALRTKVIGNAPADPGVPVVTSLRIDPCFRGHTDDTCQPQLRLILGPRSFDEAFHALYAISEDELLAFAATMADLRREYGTGAGPAELGVHDLAESPAYSQAVRAAILATVGPDNLARLTHVGSFSGLVGGGAPDAEESEFALSWEFSGIDGDGNTLPNAAGEEVQTLQTFISETNNRFDPGVTTEREAALSLASDRNGIATLPAAELRAVQETIQGLENPHRTFVDEVSCSGCHVPAPLRRLLDNQRPSEWPSDSYTTTHPITEHVAAQPPAAIGESFRMFGYWFEQPSIARRVARETADVLDDLRAR